MTIDKFVIDIRGYEGRGETMLVNLDADGGVEIVEIDECGSQVAKAEYGAGNLNAQELVDALVLKVVPNILRLRPVVATDIYRVDIPSDYGTEYERADLAVHIAREESNVYAIPSEWEVREVDGNEVVVVRRRHADPKFPEERLNLPKGEEFD